MRLDEFGRLMATQRLWPRDVFGPLPTDLPQPTPAYVPVSSVHLARSALRAVQTLQFRRTASSTPLRHPVCIHWRRHVFMRSSCEGHSGATMRRPGAFTDLPIRGEQRSPPGCYHGRCRYRDCRRSHHHFHLLVRWVALRETRFGPKTDGRTHLTSRIPPPARSFSQRHLRHHRGSSASAWTTTTRATRGASRTKIRGLPAHTSNSGMLFPSLYDTIWPCIIRLAFSFSLPAALLHLFPHSPRCFLSTSCLPPLGTSIVSNIVWS